MSRDRTPEQSNTAVLATLRDEPGASIYHIYDPWPPVAGARALCGYVKRKPHQPDCVRRGDYPDLCVVCNDIWACSGDR